MFHDFYRNVYQKSFVDDEISPEEDYIKYMRSSIPGIFEYRMEFFKSNGKFVACFLNVFFPKLMSIVGEYSCVSPVYRGNGLSTKLMRNTILKTGCKRIFIEVEKDNYVNKCIWNKFGFMKIPVDYTQFPLGSGKRAVDNLFFCAKIMEEPHDKIESELVRNVIWSYYRYTQLMNDPSNTEQYLRVVKSTSNFSKL